MSVSLKNSSVGRLALMLGFVVAWTTAMLADDKAKSEAGHGEDFYRLPEGGVDQLFEFVNKISKFTPETPEDLQTFRAHAPTALKTAAKKIVQLDQEKSSEAYKTAVDVLVELLAVEIPEAKPTAQEAMLDELLAYVAGRKELSLHDVPHVMEVAESLEQSNPKLAARAYTQISEMLLASKQERLVKIGDMLMGSVRRLQLVGNQMDVKGKTLDGAQFDLATHTGKVVLVDFWATWCPPCVAEIPNVKKLYDEYHDRGFEVVGISLDENRATLEQFVKDHAIPWPILNDEETGGHPAAAYYGINAIPAMFLVGKDGKVVSLNARGDELDRLLKEQFGSGETVKQ